MMSVISVAALKAKFESGDVPVGADFVDLIDTLNELIAQNSGDESIGMYLISDGSGAAEFEELARYPLILDYFQGSDAAAITGRKGDVGVSWSNVASPDHAEINGNRLMLDPADFGAKETALARFSNLDAKQRDFMVVIPFTLGNDGAQSKLDLFLRGTSASPRPCRVTLNGSGSSGTGSAVAYYAAGSAETVNFSFTYNASVRNILVCIVKGSSFRVYVDNVLKADIIDSQSTQTLLDLTIQHGNPSTGTHPIYLDYFLAERI